MSRCFGSLSVTGIDTDWTTGPGPHTVTGFLNATGTGAAAGAVLGGAGGAAGHGITSVLGRGGEAAASGSSHVGSGVSDTGVGTASRTLDRIPPSPSTPEPPTLPLSRPSFIADSNGTVIPTSKSRLVGGFDEAGFPSQPTTSPGTQYTLPDGTHVRVMEPSGQAPLRASFTNANGGPISPFTGKPVQPPSGLTKADRIDYIRSRTHVELGP